MTCLWIFQNCQINLSGTKLSIECQTDKKSEDDKTNGQILMKKGMHKKRLKNSNRLVKTVDSSTKVVNSGTWKILESNDKGNQRVFINDGEKLKGLW